MMESSRNQNGFSVMNNQIIYMSRVFVFLNVFREGIFKYRSNEEI